ncbi:MAG: ROK family protein [Bacteroidaceae bacterium]|nr:ROK family protein [Bacteroidaceae bacterium]
MTDNLLGIDVGGTKCAVIYGKQEGGNLRIVEKTKFATTDVNETIGRICSELRSMMSRNGLTASNTQAVGISCGGPLDSAKGIVMSPPNLPGWDQIPIVSIVEEQTGIRASLQNDANACALAEYMFGAGRGCRNMVFLTFGTGLGAGIVLDGRLYEGTNGNAGELGHIRLAPDGPIGYGKRGSFEGFCSGGGIAQLAQKCVAEAYEKGQAVDWCTPKDIPHITALMVAEAAKKGDALALQIFRTSSEYLGMGLSMVVDILNPDRIVIGSIYARNESLMRPIVESVMKREALAPANEVCRVVPAELGEQIGDYAALSLAADIQRRK